MQRSAFKRPAYAAPVLAADKTPTTKSACEKEHMIRLLRAPLIVAAASASGSFLTDKIETLSINTMQRTEGGRQW